MGRHAATPPDHEIPHHSTSRRRLDPRVVVAAAVALLLVAGGVVWWAVGSSGGSDAASCTTRTTVRVTVAPELQAVAQDVLAAPVHYGKGGCAAAQVRAERPLQTVGELQALSGTSVPDVWVPDSSLWLVRVDATPLKADGSMASSPVVMATSRAAAASLGWADQAPTWGGAVRQLLGAGHAFVVGDLGSSARELTAATAVTGSLGAGADQEVLQALLALGRTPGNTPEDALQAGVAGDVTAPLFPATEQDVIAAAHETKGSQLVAIYPSDGSPTLDYPVTRVGRPGDRRQPAVDAVVRALTSRAARDRVLAAGFRAADGAAPPDAGDATGTRSAAPGTVPVDGSAVAQLAAHVAALAQPSRLLTVIDVSTSMIAPAAGGTRVSLARDAAKSALTLLPDTYSVGLWTFAFHVDGDRDYLERVPLRALDTDVGGTVQRDALNQQLDALPAELTPGGTGLYDTTLAAVRAARDQYESGSVSSVVLLTDGKDDDDAAGISLQGLVDTLKGEADVNRPVKVIAVGLGPDADLDALKQIADATGGTSYSAQNPADLQSVLFDALRRRG
jgi:Ca-activated chloride channel homolog